MSDTAAKVVLHPLKVLFDKIVEAGDYSLRESIRNALAPVEPGKPSYGELVEGIQKRFSIQDVPQVENGRLRIGTHEPTPINEIDSIVFFSSPEGDIDVIVTEGSKEEPLSTAYSGTIARDKVDLIPEFQKVLTKHHIPNTDLAVYKRRQLTPAL